MTNKGLTTAADRIYYDLARKPKQRGLADSVSARPLNHFIKYARYGVRF